MLYRERADPSRAREAMSIWAMRLSDDPRSYDAAWKIARAAYWLGGHEDTRTGRATLERGVAAGRQAAALEPRRPEGHFWMAACMGELAESFGLRQGLRYRGAIRAALETVLRLDPAWQSGSADRALGRWYYKVPGLFGGSKKLSEMHLRRSLSYNMNSLASRFFLAETLSAMDREADATAELQRVVDTPADPDWAPEDREFKDKAAARLAATRRRP